MNVHDAERARLRTLVATIDGELSRLPRPSTTEAHGLIVSWAELVKALALGAAPNLRDCPVCGRAGMRAATRCGYCWTRLSPLPAPAPAAGPA
jgi:hypothetical protein